LVDMMRLIMKVQASGVEMKLVDSNGVQCSVVVVVRFTHHHPTHNLIHNLLRHLVLRTFSCIEYHTAH